MEKILGQALKKEREARGISLADIANETRIGTRFLKALEDEEFDVFPGHFYIHYYIKNYLHACGADVTAFFNTYQSYLKTILKKGEDVPPDQFLNKMDYTKFRKRNKILLLLLLVAIFGALVYLFAGPPKLWKPYLAGVKPVSIRFPAISHELLSGDPDLCPSRAPITARLTFTAPCWLQLWRGGEKLHERTFAKGEVVSLSGYQLVIVIANPPALRLTLNGREVTYFQRSAIALKLVVNPENLQEILER
jgi:cytoskeletal protein RodZ